MNLSKYLFLAFVLSMTLFSCTQEYIPDTKESDQQIVVEGYVESGEGSIPVFLTLTRSVPFLSTIELSTFNNLFVNGAQINVFDGSKTVQLTELCLDDLPEELRKLAAEQLGFDPDSTIINFCAYVDVMDEIDRKEGGKYDLTILADGQTITASTTIPEFVPIKNLRWDDPPGVPSDTIASLYITIDDPVGDQNYYRYLTQENNDNFLSSFSSVTDDALFDGKEFEFPLNKAERRDGDFDPETFGFYFRGDSITVKWLCIDEAHFRFWNTLEFARNNSGPFGSYNRVSSNINGGLGIWGGYAVGYYREFVPVK